MPLNYQPTQWNNEQEPPISAENLNHIEQGIKAVSDKADTLVTVAANPSGTPTDRLTGLEVDGTTYEVGGGHKVYTDGGTLLPQQPNMVVKGVYSKDNSTNNITEIEVVREFQNDAEVQALTGEEAKGFQHTPDNVYRARSAADISFDPTNTLLTSTRMQEAMEELDASNLPYSSSQSTKQKIDSLIDGNIITISTGSATISVTNSEVQIGTNQTINLKKGTYVIIGSLSASWTYAYGQFASYVDVDGTSVQVLSIANPQYTAPCILMSSITIQNDGQHTVKLKARTTHVNKTVSVEAYQDVKIAFVKIA